MVATVHILRQEALLGTAGKLFTLEGVLERFQGNSSPLPGVKVGQLVVSQRRHPVQRLMLTVKACIKFELSTASID